MKIEAKYTFQESYVPPRCRKPRYRDVDKTTTVTIKEITSEEAPIALIVTDYGTRNGIWGVCDTPYRWFGGKLYKLYRHQSGDNTGELRTIDNVKYEVSREGSGWPYDATEKKRLSDIRKAAKQFILIDSEIYKRAGEPRYCIYTFGLGHNQGGSSFSIDEHYNENISKERYFNALQRDEAITYFESVALGRGDTKSIYDDYVDNIKVLISEAVRCKPNKEHGDGCSFKNSLEAVINCSDSAVEAGLMVVAVGLAGH